MGGPDNRLRLRIGEEMAKMASLHAEQEDIQFCELCGDEVTVCDMLEECPGRWRRAAERLH
jgi:hypothetical protein